MTRIKDNVNIYPIKNRDRVSLYNVKKGHKKAITVRLCELYNDEPISDFLEGNGESYREVVLKECLKKDPKFDVVDDLVVLTQN